MEAQKPGPLAAKKRAKTGEAERRETAKPSAGEERRGLGLYTGFGKFEDDKERFISSIGPLS